MSQLAPRGTEITHQNIGDTSSRMDVRHTGEQGQMEITIDQENVRVSYTVDRERKRGPEGDRGSHRRGPASAVSSTASSGAIGMSATSSAVPSGVRQPAGHTGHMTATSHEDRTAFAEVLAGAVRDVENELQAIIEGQEEAREALRERGRQKREEGEARIEELRELLEELYGDLLAVQEEIELAAVEGQDVKKPRARTDRAEILYQEAEAALEDGNHAIVKAKAKAARTMVEGAQELLESAGE